MGEHRVIHVAGQCRPSLEAVFDGLGRRRPLGHSLPLQDEPGEVHWRLVGPGLAGRAGAARARDLGIEVDDALEISEQTEI